MPNGIGRQAYVVADDELAVLRDAMLPAMLADRITDPLSFLSFAKAGQAAAAIVSTRAATPEFARELMRMRSTGSPMPIIELMPGDARLSAPPAAWADVSVRSRHAHHQLVPRTRAALISRTRSAAARALRLRVRPVHKPDIMLCGLLEVQPPHESVIAACTRTGVPKSTAERHFTKLLVSNPAADGAPPPNFERHVLWQLMLGAFQSRGEGLPWEQIARTSHTTVRRLGKWSQTLFATDLDVLDREEIVLPVRLFEENFLPWFGVRLMWGGTI